MSAKHPYYTEIYQRSFEAIVKNGWLSEVLLALITDPLEAEDLAERLRRTKKGEKLWVHLKGRSRYPAPVSSEEFSGLSIDAKTQWRLTLSQWVMAFAQSDEALQSLIDYDRRVGVWAACKVSRESLRFVADGETRPLTAINAAEAWVMGMATDDEVRRAAIDASDAASEGKSDLSAEDAAFSAVGDQGYESYYAKTVATSVASSYATYKTSLSAYWSPTWERARSTELVRLREVVANACMTFPM